MTEPQLLSERREPMRRQLRGARRSPSSHRLNGRLAIWLVLLVALAPVPLGSNRPAIWMILAATIGLLAALYYLALSRAQASERFPVQRLGVTSLLFLVVPVALVLQLLPVRSVLTPVLALGDGVTIAASQVSLAPGATWLMLLQLLSYGMFFFLALQATVNRERAQRMLDFLYLLVVVQAVLGLLMLTQLEDTLLGFEKWAYEGAATGTFVNRNSFATFLAFGAAIGSALLVATLGAGVRQVLSLRFLSVASGLFLVVLALLATQSRMGLAAALSGSLVVILLGAIKLRIGWRVGLMLLAVAAVIIAAMVAPYGTGLLERVLELDSAASSRGELYRQIWQMVLQRPWLGYGGGAFEMAFPLFHEHNLSVDLRWNKAHSTYLALWVELGLLVGTLPLLIVASFVFKSARGFIRSEEAWVPSLAAIGVVVVAAIHSLVDFSLEIEANALLFLVVLAMGVAADDRYGRA